VLPTLAPDLGYGSLEVQDGGAAQSAWQEAVSADCAPERRQQLDEALRRYCGLDVEAMRVVARRISQRTDEKGSHL
jgi:sensor domain CHASE-containing protein